MRYKCLSCHRKRYGKVATQLHTYLQDTNERKLEQIYDCNLRGSNNKTNNLQNLKRNVIYLF